MADTIANMLKSGYVRQMVCSTAATVLSQVLEVVEYFIEVHLDSTLKWKSPLMYGRELAHKA